MRLWSIHPRYLDAAGLVALWREALLAQAVLLGRTRGYVHHPQLIRFRAARDPAALIATYLAHVADEAERRGYAFDRSRIATRKRAAPTDVTDGQLAFEWRHLKRKLRSRNRAAYCVASRTREPMPHPCFRVVPGGVSGWERAHSAGPAT